MTSQTATKTSDVRRLTTRIHVVLLVAASLCFGMTAPAQAVPFPPPPGYLADAEDSLFIPSDLAVGVELIDALQPNTAFGFYFASNSGSLGDPGTLIPIFDATDIGNQDIANPNQVAIIDFIFGFVADVDEGAAAGTDPVVEATFSPSSGNIGFYLSIGSVNIFSDPLENGGLDLFSALQNEVDPSLWWLVFDGVNADGTTSPISLNLIAGISPVPVPAALLLFGSALPLMLFARRRRRS